MKQPLGSRLHGALDFLTGASLMGASRLPMLRPDACIDAVGMEAHAPGIQRMTG